MSERWTSPKAGPWPSGHFVVHEFVSRASRSIVAVRCGLWRGVTAPQIMAYTLEPPATSQGKGCESCLRLANRDLREVREDDGSTAPVEARDVP